MDKTSQRGRERNFPRRSLKYPLFFLGLLVIIAGELGAQQLKLSFNVEVVIALAGFAIFLAGILLE